ncbi:hypothetical protein EDC94DRAFT_692805 [Helicostylum pulchrum]|nr:hypothetical protein EDC94DRAFT_692805 [Helicostylum pulchrum]
MTTGLPVKLEKKWKLKSGRNAEDVIYEEAKTTDMNSNPYHHSHIVSLADDSLQVSFLEVVEEISPGSGKSFMTSSIEQERLYTVMKYYSQQGQPTEKFPFSITASMEKGILNRYDNIWPFEHA